MKMKKVSLDLDLLDARLEYWLEKVEPCYLEEVLASMNNFRKEFGISEKSLPVNPLAGD